MDSLSWVPNPARSQLLPEACTPETLRPLYAQQDGKLPTRASASPAIRKRNSPSSLYPHSPRLGEPSRLQGQGHSPHTSPRRRWSPAETPAPAPHRAPTGPGHPAPHPAPCRACKWGGQGRDWKRQRDRPQPRSPRVPLPSSLEVRVTVSLQEILLGPKQDVRLQPGGERRGQAHDEARAPSRAPALSEVPCVCCHVWPSQG